MNEFRKLGVVLVAKEDNPAVKLIAYCKDSVQRAAGWWQTNGQSFDGIRKYLDTHIPTGPNLQLTEVTTGPVCTKDTAVSFGWRNIVGLQ